MGNSNQPKQLNTQYNQLSIQQSQFLSRLIIVEDKLSKQKFMIKQINIANELQYNKIIKEIQQRKILSLKKAGKYMIQLKHFQTKQSTEICGKNYKILLYLQHLQVNLKHIYTDKLSKKQSFSQQQLLNIIKWVINCLIILHDNNYKNIFLYKQTIFIGNNKQKQNGYKIIDTQLSNKIHPYYQILNNVPTKVGTYLAPELLKQLKRQNYDFYQSPKADIFTLAVIILQLSTFSNCDHFYDYQNKQIHLNEILKLIDKMSYGCKLKNVLNKMLIEQQEQRIGLISLKQLLSNDDDLYSINSISHNPQEQKTVRLFGSKYRREQGINNSNSMNNSKYNSLQRLQIKSKAQTEKQNNKSKVNNRFIPQYSTKGINYQTKSMKQQPKNHKIMNAQPLIKPNQSFQRKQQLKLKKPSFIQDRQTPRSLDIHKVNHPYWLRQYQTPVNILNQHLQTQTTPINKFQQFNSNYYKQQDNASRSTQERIAHLRHDIFNNRNYGKHVFKNGARYQGELNQKGEFDGNGILYYPNDQICYSGSWKNNAFHGFGVLNNQKLIPPPDNMVNYSTFDLRDFQSWKYYEGEFNQDKRDGFGTLYLLNDDKFSGCFKDDEIQGFGTYFISKQNRNVNGIWANSVLKR